MEEASGEAPAEVNLRVLAQIPTHSLGRLLFYGSVGIICYLAYQWAKGKIREELANLLLECQQAQKEQELASQKVAPTAQEGIAKGEPGNA